MALVLFYHLTRSPAEETAATLLPRALGAGWRVMVRGTDLARLAHLDQRLWLEPEDGFLPHGLEGGAQDADQPILLGLGPIANQAQALMLVDGAVPQPGEAARLERVWVLFDGLDETALNAARGLWKAVTAEGIHAQYWSEETGRWQMKTEKKPA
ncbi:DNA polymerase III subunit chi [Gemmobacter fulvus]|uniref:DNA polymerase III subunit chi n=1 Tax=Gemmobacter fulvus TaxID=2840474 RepID=UPI002796A9B4|nr:DNA polymerase III subunit chi [Gemmobacter fulvus]MDQ1848159.1 DNA polymerase III subunit chi [Gemmobacter fulvus]